MSAKDAPIALRSHQTMIGVIDKWRIRRDWIDQHAQGYRRCSAGCDACNWAARLDAAHEWERQNG